jgi:hypothetical protein
MYNLLTNKSMNYTRIYFNSILLLFFSIIHYIRTITIILLCELKLRMPKYYDTDAKSDIIILTDEMYFLQA